MPGSEPPVCASCGARHWFLDPCGVAGPGLDVPRTCVSFVVEADLLAPLPTPDEVTKALRYYRRHLARERDRQRTKRGASNA